MLPTLQIVKYFSNNLSLKYPDEGLERPELVDPRINQLQTILMFDVCSPKSLDLLVDLSLQI
jgi:hypothetical protein